jgi:zinc protease
MIQFNKHHLKNGLTLIHHLDDTTPFVVVNVLYKVGSRDEEATRTGFAHLFEHLMFEGTKHQKNFDHPIQEAGGVNNAFTNNDFTNYYIKLPKENLKLALWLEADRMQHLDINAKSLKTQKKVVVEEFKENYTNHPYGDVWHILREMVYKEHPYQWPTIGKDFDHINKANLEDVISFYKKHYQPQNAILSVCGNVNEQDVLEAAALLMDNIPNEETEISAKQFHEPQQLAPTFKIVHREIPLDAIYIVFKMPERTQHDYYVADVLSDILASGKSSRLKEKLTKQQPYFISIDAYITGSIDEGMFVFEGKLKEGISPEDAKAAVWREIELLQSELISERELEKVKNKLITYMNFSENDLMSRAIGLCYHEMLNDASEINREEERYLSVNATDIQLFATTYFQPNLENTLFYLKNK